MVTPTRSATARTETASWFPVSASRSLAAARISPAEGLALASGRPMPAGTRTRGY